MESIEQSGPGTNRRSFLVKGAAVGAGAIVAARGLADPSSASAGGQITKGDVAILQFLAAAELLEADLWEQYNELAGIQDSELRAAAETAAYTRRCRAGRGHAPVHPRQRRRRAEPRELHQRLSRGERRGPDQPGQVPHPAQQQGDRRASDRPADQLDAAHDRHQLVDALSERLAEPGPRRHAASSGPGSGCRAAPGDPRSDDDLSPAKHLQAIANTAGFHFASSSRAASSLYASLAQRVTTPRCCASCSASARPRRCTSRPGRTRPAMLPR